MATRAKGADQRIIMRWGQTNLGWESERDGKSERKGNGDVPTNKKLKKLSKRINLQNFIFMLIAERPNEYFRGWGGATA